MRRKTFLLSLLLCLALLSGCGGAGTVEEENAPKPAPTPEISASEDGGGEEDAGSAEPQSEQYLFSAYTEWDMYILEDGDPDSVFARVDLRYERPEWDLEARAEALEYVMKHPAPIGGFQSFASEMAYAREIHDYVACQVTYDPMGYDPYDMLYPSNYDSLQEAYNVLGEGQDTAPRSG